MSKTTKEIVIEQCDSEGTIWEPDELWFSQPEVDNLMSENTWKKETEKVILFYEKHFEQLRKELVSFFQEEFEDDTQKVELMISYVFDKHGLVDTNKVAGEEPPSQAGGLRETKEGANPSKPNMCFDGLEHEFNRMCCERCGVRC